MKRKNLFTSKIQCIRYEGHPPDKKREDLPDISIFFFFIYFRLQPRLDLIYWQQKQGFLLEKMGLKCVSDPP